MRHHNKNRKFGRVRRQRTALMRALAQSLIIHGKIKTTEARAKELRPFIEKLITKGKTNSVATHRVIVARLGGRKQTTKRLIETVAPEYKKRDGGYTRITKLPPRLGDGSKMAIIEFI